MAIGRPKDHVEISTLLSKPKRVTLARKVLRNHSHFKAIQNAIFWPSDLSKILNQHQSGWDAWDVTSKEMAAFLVEESLLKRAEFTSPNYDSIIRYVRGSPSPHKLALSLRRDSFLSHQTALLLHELAPASSTVYVNKEQSPKPEPAGLTQASINLAFKNPQRQSNYRFQYDDGEYLLISGKNTGRAGVIRMKTKNGDELDSTDLERTLIDIVVRPAYAGGVEKVAAVYNAVFHKVDVNHLANLLRNMNYLYPYAQSIGFLLQRAGRPEKDLKKLEDLRSEFDFFLDYGLETPPYDKTWRLYYPASLIFGGRR